MATFELIVVVSCCLGQHVTVRLDFGIVLKRELTLDWRQIVMGISLKDWLVFAWFNGVSVFGVERSLWWGFLETCVAGIGIRVQVAFFVLCWHCFVLKLVVVFRIRTRVSLIMLFDSRVVRGFSISLVVVLVLGRTHDFAVIRFASRHELFTLEGTQIATRIVRTEPWLRVVVVKMVHPSVVPRVELIVFCRGVPITLTGVASSPGQLKGLL